MYCMGMRVLVLNACLAFGGGEVVALWEAYKRNRVSTSHARRCAARHSNRLMIAGVGYNRYF